MTTSSFDEVLRAARSLPDTEQLSLVEALLGSLPPDVAASIDDVWLMEIERRSAEIDSGAVQPIPWETVRQRARERARLNG